MKNRLFAAFLAFVALSLFVSSTGLCAGPAPYVIGYPLDLTGISAPAGIAQKRGAEYTIDKINATGGINGRKLKAIFMDGQSIAVNTVKNAKRLIDVDKITVLGGYTDMVAVFSSIQMVTDSKTPFIVGAPCLPSHVPPPSPWVYTVIPDQGVGSIPVIAQNLLDRGCKKIAQIYVDFIYGQNGNKYLVAYLEKKGMKLVAVEKYAMDAVEFDSQVARIKASGADGLIITGGGPDTVKIMKTAKNLGFTGKIVAEYGVVSPEFLKLSGKDAEGLVSSSSRYVVAPELAADDPQKKVCMELYGYYGKKFGGISQYAANSYDQVNVIAEALKKVDPKLDPSKDGDLAKIREQVKDAVEGVKNLVGINAIYTYSATDHVGVKEGCYVPIVVKDGKWALYK